MNWTDTVRFWGTTAEERQRSFACDKILPEYNDAYYRGVTVFADAATVFRWLCQMRVAPYSYDWIDNLGRTSPRRLSPELENLALGQRFMNIFDLVDFERDVHITLRLHSPGLFPAMAVTYFVDAKGDSQCRLIVKLAIVLRPGLRDRLLRLLLPPGDLVMMRRQLLNLKALAEGAS